MVTFFVRASESVYLKPEMPCRCKYINSAGLHGRNCALGLPAACRIAALTQLAHTAAKGYGFVISVEKYFSWAAKGHSCSIPAMYAKKDSCTVTVHYFSGFVIGGSLWRTAMIMTVAAAAELAFEYRPWRCCNFPRINHNSRIRPFFFKHFYIFIRVFTNAAGQEAPTSISRGRNARISGVIFFRQCFSPEIWYNGFGEEREALYMQQTITAKLQILVLGKYSRGY